MASTVIFDQQRLRVETDGAVVRFLITARNGETVAASFVSIQNTLDLRDNITTQFTPTPPGAETGSGSSRSAPP